MSGQGTRLLVVFLLSCVLCAAQSERPANSGDLGTYLAFFRFQEAMSREIESRRKADSARGEAFEKASANVLNVETRDLTSISQISQQVRIAIEAIDQDGMAYKRRLEQERVSPDVRVLRSFQQRKEQVAIAAMRALRSALPEKSWTGLDKYINSSFREGIVRLPVPSKEK